MFNGRSCIGLEQLKVRFMQTAHVIFVLLKSWLCLTRTGFPDVLQRRQTRCVVVDDSGRGQSALERRNQKRSAESRRGIFALITTAIEQATHQL